MKIFMFVMLAVTLAATVQSERLPVVGESESVSTLSSKLHAFIIGNDKGGLSASHAQHDSGSHAMTTTVDSISQFEQTLKQNPLVVAAFGATWCGPCRASQPIFKKLSEEYKNFAFVTIDIDAADLLSTRYGVIGIPTFIFLKEGNEDSRIDGANISALEDKILEYSEASSD